MFNNLKLGPKFFLSLMLISLLPLAVISISNYYYSKRQIEKNTIGNLKAINNSRAAHINHIIQLRQEQAKELAGTYVVKQLKATGVNNAQDINRIQAHIDSIFNELKSPTQSNYKFIDQESSIQNISVWDIYGNIVADTNRKLIGRRMSDTFLHILYKQGAYFLGFDKDPLTAENFLTILEEIRNWQTGEYAGVAFLKFSAKALNDITTDRQGLGKTAETYIVDKKNRMITESRFIKDAILKQKVNTSATKTCFNQKEASVVYTDYRGREVLGVHKYLSDQEWCIITEIDVKEAFEPIQAFRNQILIVVGCFVVIITIAVHLFGRAFIAPITKLRNASFKVARGNYDVETSIQTQDEIGELSTAFDQMTKILESTTSQLKEKNKILEDQKDELKKFDELKSEFVSTVSHELRTPMTIIKDSIMQLLDEVDDVSPEDKKMLLSMALRNIDRLANLINNLLDLSKIEAGKIDLQKEQVDIVALSKEVTQSFEAQAKKKNLEMRHSASAKEILMNIDRDKIIQVFFNLIGNSIKFVEKGFVEVSVKEEGDWVVCTIADTGRGISKEDLEKVFSKFQQFGKSGGAGVKGTGLGLSICKGMIDLHGGDIWVESELEKGTKFIFKLPKNDVPQETKDVEENTIG